MCMHMLTLNWLAVCMLEQTGTYTFYIHRIRIGKDKDTTCMYLHMSIPTSNDQYCTCVMEQYKADW